MLSIKYSHQVSHLAQDLMRMLANSDVDPLQTTPIVVQSNGMAQWLKMQIADQQGICANVQFPFASSYLWRIIRQAPALEIPSLTPFDKPVLVWRLLALFQDKATLQRWPALQHYVDTQQRSQQAQYYFAYQLADVYDQYQLYRPEWVRAWRAGDFSSIRDYPDNLWQAQLWHWLNNNSYLDSSSLDSNDKAVTSPRSRTDWLLKFPELLPELAAAGKLPNQLFLFGISSLPPLILQLYQALAEYSDITLYLLNPSEMYWGDQLSAKEAQRVAEQQGGSIDDLLASQNPLLASMGRLGRDFIDQLLDAADMIPLADEIEYPSSQATDELPVDLPLSTDELPVDLPLFATVTSDDDQSLLSCIQQQIRCAAPASEFPLADSAMIEGSDSLIKDASIVITSSYTPKREVEVLHDYIAEWLNSGDYQPTDILVMTPDIQTYGSLVQRHFSQATPYIPYSVADSSNGVQLNLSTLLLDVLKLVNKRCNITELLKILEQPQVMERFELDGLKVTQITKAVENIGIRWGLSREHIRQFSVENTGYTWGSGLQKVMLQSVYGNAVNLDSSLQAQGSDRNGDGYVRTMDDGLEQALSQFWNFYHIIDRFVYQALQTQTPQRWVEICRDLVNTLIAPDDDMRHAHESLMNQLAQIADAIEVAEHWITAMTVDADVISAYLEQMLPDSEGKQGFLSGGVTIGSMVPMRSIPFKIIAFLGLNDGIFPRQHQSADFDLSQKQYKLGDRNRRSDDRYMFLEALMATQEKLYLSYNGREPIKNQHKPPSPIVTEFMAVMAETMQQPLSKLQQQYVDETSLQAYSPRNFSHNFSGGDRGGDLGFASYNQKALRMAQTLVMSSVDIGNKKSSSERWLVGTPNIGNTAQVSAEIIKLQTLQRFWLKPASVWLSKALGGAIPRQDESAPSAEVFELSPLQKYQQRDLLANLAKELISSPQAFGDEKVTEVDVLAKILALFDSKNIMPEGSFGADLKQRMQQGWVEIFESLGRHTKHCQKSVRVETTWQGGAAIIPAILTVNDDNALLSVASVKGDAVDFRAIFNAWISHVCANVWQMQQGQHSLPSQLITLSPLHEKAVVSSYTFTAIEKPRPILNALLNDYNRGQTELLPWLPDASSIAYKKQLLELQETQDSKELAKFESTLLKNWHDKWQYDEALQLLYPDNDVLHSALFLELAMKHMAPVFSHCPELLEMC
jgi:exodeoxyribonuclease V gamma subunit